jgi:hypothetical protein
MAREVRRCNRDHHVETANPAINMRRAMSIMLPS